MWSLSAHRQPGGGVDNASPPVAQFLCLAIESVYGTNDRATHRMVPRSSAIGAVVDLKWAGGLSGALEESEAGIEPLIVGNKAWRS